MARLGRFGSKGPKPEPEDKSKEGKEAKESRKKTRWGKEEQVLNVSEALFEMIKDIVRTEGEE